MVRLVVLIVIMVNFLTACSVLPKPADDYDPRVSQSTESSRSETTGSNYADAVDDLLRLDEGQHHPAVQVLLTQAEQARQEGNSSQALAYLDQARQIQPRNSAIFYRQAWLNYQLGELQQARQLLQRAQVFLRKSVVNHTLLQHRITALKTKVDARYLD